MIRKWKLLFVGVSCIMGTAMAQNNPILLFPERCARRNNQVDRKG